jgi:2-dehydro-3-deoxyphosphogluconate aldolase/(4S)-4-hydroxy-2-oxoglutarate aldolase
MPTGGINASNIAKYIAYEKILACGGSWMVGADLINAGDFGKITALCREAVTNMLGFTMIHVGINTPGAGEAIGAGKLLSSLFGFYFKEGNSSVFAGDGIEIMKSQGYGKNGHIAIATNSIQRAVAWLERQGIKFNPESVKKDAKGAMNVIFFQEDIAGFAVHLLQKK